MLCPQNAVKTRMQPFVIHNSRPRAYACEVQIPMRERWVWLRDTFTLLPRVIMQVSGSKFTLNHGFMGFCSNLCLVLCWYWYILHASDRNRSLDVIGCWILWRSKPKAVSNCISGVSLWETTVLRGKYSAMVLINGLAHGLSKRILKTPQTNKQHKKLDFHYRGTLSIFK